MTDAVNYKTIVEGSTTMYFPADQESTVFYNPVQVQNRDLSILMISLAAERRAVRQVVKAQRKAFRSEGVSNKELSTKMEEYEASLDSARVLSEQDPALGLTILDALAASGLRSIRYWKEIPGTKHVTINDLDAAAVERAWTNLKHNNVMDVVLEQNDTRDRGIHVQNGDATHELYLSRRPQLLHVDESRPPSLKPRWDVIDLDPYGSAAPFLDAAVQGIEDGGFLCVTCTDMAALGGSHPETCFGRYASMPIPRAGYLQEMALRILLHSLATTAAKYGRTIKPILSVGMNFYIRVFVEVYDDKAGVNALSLKLGRVFQSTQCASFHIKPVGQLGGKNGNGYQPGRVPDFGQSVEIDESIKVGGPIWLGPLHDKTVVKVALDRLESKDETVLPSMKWIATKDRLRGLLTSCHEELSDVPLFYNLPQMAQTLNATTPPLIKVKAALLNAGFRVSGYHKEPQAIKTNAPNQVLWDVLRVWCKENPPNSTKNHECSVAHKILTKTPTTHVDFSVPMALRVDRGIARFPQNPEPHWGPKKAATGHKRKAESDADRK
jgi:tRNA (guanine26-N2/guanine27-N2)-dimethyltransferase